MFRIPVRPSPVRPRLVIYPQIAASRHYACFSKECPRCGALVFYSQGTGETFEKHPCNEPLTVVFKP